MTLRRIVKIDPQTWPILSQLLDEWLDLPPEARSSWMENLGPEYADVLPALRELLAAQAMGGADTFLNALPALSDAGESATSAEAGVVFITAQLLTAIMWARPIWGPWWVWDARTTMQVVLYLILIAYLMLRVAHRAEVG